MDIRKLNDIAVPDLYPAHLQSEIIANLQGCTNLVVFDAAYFFHQWR